MNPRNFFAELKRRNVYKVAVAYAVVGWLVIQISSTVLPTFHAPEWVLQTLVVLVALGFPIALVLAWAFELTPEGIKRAEDVPSSESITRKTGQKLIRTTIVLAVIAAGMLVFQLLRPRLMRDSAATPTQFPVAVSPAIPEKSIAVLPFENLSDNKENAYFADGVQDEILTDLAKVADLKVISRTSVMQYRDAAARNLRQIGQQLGVAHVLEGSVQRAANKIRVNAQLIDARDDAHLWAHTYDRDLADVFVIQSEIAETIAGQLQAQLSPREKAAIAEAPTKDVVANDLYVRARALDDMVNDPGAKEHLLQGISLLEEAVRRDPKFVLAYCLMCETQLDLYWYGIDHTTARREQAHAALQEAERIQPDAGEVHMHKGLYAYGGFRDYATARAEFELARRTLPNSSRLYLHLGAVDRRQARWDEALRNFYRAIELDPRNFVVVEEAGFTNGGLNRYGEARKLLQQALALSPRDYFVRMTLAQMPYFEHADLAPLEHQLDLFREEGAEARSNMAEAFVVCALAKRNRAAAEQDLTYIPEEGVVNEVENFLIPRAWFVGLVARTFGDNSRAQNAFAAARAIEAKIVQEQPEYAPAWSMLGLIDAGLGRNADAIAEGKRACELLSLAKDAWEGPSYVVNLAIIYSWVGEKDLALEQLAISTENPVGISYGELKLQSFWDSLRDDPRFEKIVASFALKANAREPQK
jgi:TolB-like protein